MQCELWELCLSKLCPNTSVGSSDSQVFSKNINIRLSFCHDVLLIVPFMHLKLNHQHNTFLKRKGFFIFPVDILKSWIFYVWVCSKMFPSTDWFVSRLCSRHLQKELSIAQHMSDHLSLHLTCLWVQLFDSVCVLGPLWAECCSQKEVNRLTGSVLEGNRPWKSNWLLATYTLKDTVWPNGPAASNFTLPLPL